MVKHYFFQNSKVLNTPAEERTVAAVKYFGLIVKNKIDTALLIIDSYKT